MIKCQIPTVVSVRRRKCFKTVFFGVPGTALCSQSINTSHLSSAECLGLDIRITLQCTSRARGHSRLNKPVARAKGSEEIKAGLGRWLSRPTVADVYGEREREKKNKKKQQPRVRIRPSVFNRATQQFINLFLFCFVFLWVALL